MSEPSAAEPQPPGAYGQSARFPAERSTSGQGPDGPPHGQGAYGPPHGQGSYGPPPERPPGYGQVPHPHGYGPEYGSAGPRHYQALRGAAPVSAGLQIAARLVEGLIISIPIILLSTLAVVPFVAAVLAAAAGYDSGAVGESPAGTDNFGDAGVIVAAFLVTAGIIFLIWLLIALALIWWLAVKGGSVGNAIFGLRLVSTDTGQPIGWGKALLWYLVVIVGTLITGGILGLLFVLSPLFDSTSGWNQAWQDKMIGAVLINTRMGRDTIAR